MQTSAENRYRIRLAEQPAHEWVAQREGWTGRQEGAGYLLSGPVKDQAELFGLLRRIRDQGLTLVSLTQEVSMNTKALNNLRTTSVITGVIFIVATAAALLGSSVDPILADPKDLSRIPTESVGFFIGALFHLVAALASVGIAIIVFPLCQKRNPALALAAVAFRTIEAVFYMAGVGCLLSLATLAQVPADPARLTFDVALGGFLVKAREHATLLGVVAFCLGAGSYYLAFFQTRVVPRWLSVWGLVAVPLMLAACILALFSDSPITGYVIFVLPIAVQEMVLAVWLIVQGFREPEAES